MNKEIIGVINSIEWYRQGVDSAAFYIWTPAQSVTIEFNGTYSIFSLEGMHMEGYYAKKVIVGQAKEFLAKAKKDRKAVGDESLRFEKSLKELDAIFSKIEKTNLRQLDRDSLIALFKELDDVNFDFWLVNWMSDKFDPEGHEMLMQEIEDAGAKLTDEDVEHLTLPAEANFMDMSELDLYKLAKKLKQKSKEFSDKEILDELKDYAKEYFYVQNSWLVAKIMHPNDFLKPLKDVLNESDDDITKRINRLSNKKSLMTKKTEEIITKNSIGKELENVFCMYRRLSELRDIRKYYVLKLIHFHYLFAQRLGEIYDIDTDTALMAIPPEFFEADTPEKMKALKKQLESRRTILIAIGKNNRDDYELFENNEAEQYLRMLQKLLLDKHDEIKGMCACRGKAEGVVRIILGHTHFAKFKDGDILVAPMTRPEYIPLMKRAKAIITDEGGLTSHAAIISRELNKPCIVGTQVATHKLADNDKVFVDADTGIVRLLKD